MNTKHSTRILLAKIGLDGHDRGVKVLARSFRDAGIEVIYTGLWQTSEVTMHAAMQEDVDLLGVSLLSAAHMTIMPELIRHRDALGIGDMPVVLGGIVPERDYEALKSMGVAATFNPGSPMEQIIATINELAAGRRCADVESCISGYAKGDERSLAGLLTHVQQGREFDNWQPPPGTALTIGVTGPKLAITGEGAIWYTPRSAAVAGAVEAGAGVLYPDVSKMKSLAAYY